MAEQFMIKKAYLAVIKHTLQYKVDQCRHKWLTCDDARVLFCMHCNDIKSDTDKKQQQKQA